MRTLIKHLAERTLVATGVEAALRRRVTGRTLVLAYHNIVEGDHGGVGDTSLHLSRADFARQLDVLTRTHDVVPLTAILDDRRQGTRPRVVITFDDAYLGAVDLGVRELARRGLPATIFATPGLLGRHPWWDLLADPRIGAVDASPRDHALSALAGDTTRVLDWAAAAGRALQAGRWRIATEAELIAASRTPGIGVGSHTWSHANLAAISTDEARDELRRSDAWLRARMASYVPWVSYPYGLHTTAVEHLSAEVFAGAFRVDGGWMLGDDRPHALPRFNVPAGLSIDGFRLRLAGLSRL